MSNIAIAENEPCKHADLKEYKEHTEIYEIKGKTKEMQTIRISHYYYCSDCNTIFNLSIRENKINQN